jgi:hypothetical protein
MSEGSAAVYHDHPALTAATDQVTHQRVVFEAFDGDDFTAEAPLFSEVGKQGLRNADVVGEVVADIGD